MAQANGYIVYEGPSRLTGGNIVVIATGFANKSTNSKTGDLIQTWIMSADESPTEAANSGRDEDVCGSCRHRGIIVDGKNVDRACYVTLFQAPLNVWKTWKRGGYAPATGAQLSELTRGLKIRLGSYGDPAAVPFYVWQDMMAFAEAGTGYTHAWQDASPELADFCMASADTHAEKLAAKNKGYRTFRVKTEDAPKIKGEVTCPASKEAGQKTNCAACLACGGNSAKAKASIVINAHGAVGKVNAHRRVAA